MDEQVVFIILAIVFWLIKTFFSKDKKKKSTPKPKRKRTNNSPKRTLQDALEEFVLETQNKPRKNLAPIPKKVVPDTKKPVLTHISSKEKKKEALNWQKVDKTKIKEQEQLIYHEDYHKVHAENKRYQSPILQEAIADSEGNVYRFNPKKINWKDAIIAKEILDRKYS